MSSPEPVARVARPEEDPLVQDLVERCFGRRPTARWQWQYGGSSPCDVSSVIVEVDGLPRAHLGLMRCPGWVHGQPATIEIGMDAATDPAYRRKGLRSAIRAFPRGGVDVGVHFPSDEMIATSVRGGQGVEAGRMPQWTHWIRPDPQEGVVRRLASGLAAITAGVLRHLPSRARATRASWDDERLSSEIDQLASRSAAFAPCLRRRSAAYLRWRWAENPVGEWTLWQARDADDCLAGVAVAGVTPVDGQGHIVEMMADGPGPAAALLRRACRFLAPTCPLVSFDYQDPRSWVRTACRAAGFIRRGTGPNVQLVVHSAAARAAAADRLDSWLLTSGDGDRY